MFGFLKKWNEPAERDRSEKKLSINDRLSQLQKCETPETFTPFKKWTAEEVKKEYLQEYLTITGPERAMLDFQMSFTRGVSPLGFVNEKPITQTVDL